MTVRDVIEHNQTVLADGGPRLTDRYRSYVAAQDRSRTKVLVAGLGAMGVGRMWMPERPEHAELPGYADAPDGDSKAPIDPQAEADRERAGDRA